MELIRYLHNLKQRHRDCVVTIGNFDGVHLGHQAVIQQLNRYAKDHALPAVVIIFEPQPLEYFVPEKAPTRLSSFRKKVEWLGEHDVDMVICLHFKANLAELSAEQFVEEILIKEISAKCIIVGDDFKFGKDRKGDYSLLESMSKQISFKLASTDTLFTGSERVSSSQIRELLSAARMSEAEALLGRPYSMIGRVIYGDKRGRKLGFPTANIAIKRWKSPVLGVFAVKIDGLHNTVYEGVANVGTCPVFDGKQVLLEVHILNFDAKIYGKHLRISFLKRIREEQKFASIKQLQEQINLDIDATKLFFTKAKTSDVEQE